MTLQEIRSNIRSIRRKLARPSAQLIIQRMADDLSQEWSRAKADRQPLPDPRTFIIRVVDTEYGSWIPNSGSQHSHLSCASSNAAAPRARSHSPGKSYAL